MGGILGIFDGLTAWFTPAVRAGIVGIVIDFFLPVFAILRPYFLSVHKAAKSVLSLDELRAELR